MNFSTPPGQDSSAERNSRQNARHDAITEAVISAGTIRIDELTEQFGVSRMTMHRDIQALEERGILRRSRGVATAVATSLFEASLEFRSRQHRDEKDALAAKALELIEPGDAVVFDDSTTSLHLARRLGEREPLTVITNFGRILEELKGRRSINLISTGGEYSQASDAYCGWQTLNALKNLAADIYIMSAAAVIGDVCYHPRQDIVLIKQAMLAAARRTVLVVDHSKFRRRALHAIASIKDVDVVVVDSNIEQSDLQRLRQTGTEIRIAEVRPVHRANVDED